MPTSRKAENLRTTPGTRPVPSAGERSTGTPTLGSSAPGASSSQQPWEGAVAHPCLQWQKLWTHSNRNRNYKVYQVAHRIQRKTTRLSRRAGTTGGWQLRTRQPCAGAGPHQRLWCWKALGGQGTLAGTGSSMAGLWTACAPPCGLPPTPCGILGILRLSCPCRAHGVSGMVWVARGALPLDAPDSSSG